MKTLKSILLTVIVCLMITGIGFADINLEFRQMTDTEFIKLMELEGIYQPEVNYNVIINGYGTGLRPPTEDDWEQLINTPIIVDLSQPLRVESAPSNYDNSLLPYFPPIGNQDGEGSCVSWATGYYTKTFQEAFEHGWDLSGALWEGGYYGYPNAAYQDKIFSPDFIYHQVCDGEDEGSTYADNLNLMENIGACTWGNMPYDPLQISSWPSESAFREAPMYRSRTGYGYMFFTTDTQLEQLKIWLSDTNLVIISVDADQYNDLNGNDLWTTDVYQNNGTNHANTIVGYDDNYGPYTENGETRYGAFKVANSWGEGSWENVDDGFYYISYEAVKSQVQYCFLYENEVNYEPRLLAVFNITHEYRGENRITFGIGNPSSPTNSKMMNENYHLNGGNYPFGTENMALDITEFMPYYTGTSDIFFMSVYDTSTSETGSINSFSIEYYDNYASGTPIETFIASDTPVNTSNYEEVVSVITVGATPDISVSPTSLTEELESGESSTQILTISNTGNNALEFTISISGTNMSAGTNISDINLTGINIVNRTDFGATQNSATCGYDISTRKQSTFAAYQDLKASQSTSGGNILWDITHGVYSYEPSGNFSLLTGLLNSAGYNVMTTDAGVDNVDLSTYDILVICEGSAKISSYTTSEIDAISQFVNQGGGLLILGDNASCSNENINPLAEEFGISLGLSTIEPYDLYFSNFTSLEIFEGINEIYYRAAGEISASAPAEIEAFTSNNEGVIASNVSHPGRVLALGDINVWDNEYITNVDNQAFAENVFNWLSQTNSSIDWLSCDSYSGTVQAGYSQDIEVTFDATGLTPDTYTASLDITSNDPDEPVVNVPVDLTVTNPNPPDISVLPTSLSETLAVDETSTQTLTIYNDGIGDLNWEIENIDSTFTLDVGVQIGTYSGMTRGYWLIAPIDFVITNLRVPTDIGFEQQYIQVIQLNDIPPEYSNSTTDYTTLFYSNTHTGSDWVECEIPIHEEDIIGIFGVRSTSVMNSYGESDYQSSIGGIPTQLTRLIYQGSITSGPTADGISSSESGSIGRVEMKYYTSTGGIIPSWLEIDNYMGTIAPDSSENIEVTFDATGLTPDTYTASLDITSNDPDEPLIIVPVTLNATSDTCNTTLSGHVTDASSGNSIEGAIVTLSGITDTTDSFGCYLLENVPPGELTANFMGSPTSIEVQDTVYFTDLSTDNTQTVTASALGYIDYINQQVEIIEDQDNTLEISLSSEITEGELRFVLTWDDDPNDLDSHLKTPDIEGTEYHIYYASKGDSINAPYAILDIDDVTGYGPETITVYESFTGTYQYYIYKYSGNEEIIQSNANVSIYDNTGLIQSLNVPTSGDGRYWYICDIDGASQNITLVNEIRLSAPGTADQAEFAIKTIPDNEIVQSSNISSWEWDFGDGNTSTNQNPFHIYTDAGDFTVSLTVSDSINQDTEEKENYISVVDTSFDISLTIGDTEAAANTLVNISILVDSGFTNVAMIDLHIDYDITMLHYQDMNSTYLSSGDVSHVNNVINTIWVYSGTPMEIPDGDTLMVMNFQVDGSVVEGQSCRVGFTGSNNIGDPDENAYSLGLHSGTFTVISGYSISGLLTYCDNASPLAGDTLRLSGDMNEYAIADANGNFNFDLVNGSLILNPVKHDNISEINGFDLLRLKNNLLGITTLSPNALLAADCNGSGSVDGFDLLRLKNYLLMLPVDPPIATWDFTPQEYAYDPITANMTNQNFSAYIYGDVNLNWGISSTAIAKNSDQTVSKISFNNFRLDDRGYLYLPIYSDTDIDIAMIDWSVNFDTSAFKFERINSDLIADYNCINDRINLLWLYNGEEIHIEAGVEIAVLVFQPKEDQESGTIAFSKDNYSAKADEKPIHIEFGSVTINLSLLSLFEDGQLPTETTLYENYPNPFNPNTQITYYLKDASNVLVNIYNLKGQKVYYKNYGYQSPGLYQLLWNACDNTGKPVSTGIYLYQLVYEYGMEVKRMVYMK